MPEKQTLFQKATALGTELIQFAEKFKLPVESSLLLGIRLWLACVFWQSGLTKIANWDTTIFLFAEEYKVPIIPPEIAAFLGTGVELIAPLMLITGFGTRLAALALLGMTATIEFTYVSHLQHLYWAAGCIILMVMGSGMLGWDVKIRQKFMQNAACECALGKLMIPLAILALTLLAFNEVGAAILGLDALTPQLKMLIETFQIKPAM